MKSSLVKRIEQLEKQAISNSRQSLDIYMHNHFVSFKPLHSKKKGKTVEFPTIVEAGLAIDKRIAECETAKVVICVDDFALLFDDGMFAALDEIMTIVPSHWVDPYSIPLVLENKRLVCGSELNESMKPYPSVAVMAFQKWLNSSRDLPDRGTEKFVRLMILAGELSVEFPHCLSTGDYNRLFGGWPEESKPMPDLLIDPQRDVYDELEQEEIAALTGRK